MVSKGSASNSDQSRAEAKHRLSLICRLPFVGKDIHALLKAIGMLDAQADIDANAANELLATPSDSIGAPAGQSGSGQKADDKASRFAAGVTRNAQEPPASSPTSSSCCTSPERPTQPGQPRIEVLHKPAEDDSGERKLAPVVIFLTGGAWSIGYKVSATSRHYHCMHTALKRISSPFCVTVSLV